MGPARPIIPDRHPVPPHSRISPFSPHGFQQTVAGKVFRLQNHFIWPHAIPPVETKDRSGRHTGYADKGNRFLFAVRYTLPFRFHAVPFCERRCFAVHLLSVSFPNRIVKQDRKQADSFYDLFCTVKKDPARKSLQGLLAIGFASGFAIGCCPKTQNVTGQAPLSFFWAKVFEFWIITEKAEKWLFYEFFPYSQGFRHKKRPCRCYSTRSVFLFGFCYRVLP